MSQSDTPKALLQALDLIRGPRATAAAGRRAAATPESLDAVESRHVERVRRIFEDRNIVGVGIAEKVTEKAGTGELGICFYVEKKIPKAKLDTNHLIPPVLSVADRTAVFTDVRAIGKVRPQINKKRSPIASGFSVGSDVDTGTLGAIVKKGRQLFLLSNSHVFARSGKGKVGDDIIYPGEADSGARTQHVGGLAKFVPFVKGDDFLNHVDAALAEIDDEFLSKLDFRIRGVRGALGTIAPARGMKIVTRGRTSGDTSGEIEDVNFSIVVEYDGVGKIGFIDQVQCTRYSRPGDSGALIVDKASGKIVGLHFAGSGNISVCNPIDQVVKALKFRFADGA